MKYFNFKNKNSTIIKHANKVARGFTLIEIMVATSIFMIIMLVALGALVTSSTAAKDAKELRTAMDNINFAMENMTRSLRTGSEYSCNPDKDNPSISIGVSSVSQVADCPNGGGGILFTSANQPVLSYDAGYGIGKRLNGTHTIFRYDSNFTNGAQDLLANEVDIQKLVLYVNGSYPADNIQPSIRIVIKGTVTIKGTPTEFAIQTMASQRSSE